MANESITEDIVREHFKKYIKSNIFFEPQQSENLKIKGLLKNASKSGIKEGRPEFFIHGFDFPFKDLLIIIECKYDVSKHESKDRNNPKDYAVDGVLHYASFLSKEYDVLAIAVSGNKINNLKVSHFLHLKQSNKANLIQGNELLPIDDYLKLYIQDDYKFKQDFNELLSYSGELNEKLHIHKIPENQRSLLISGILIALKNNAFKNSFKAHNTGQDLTNALVTTIKNEFLHANLDVNKIDKLINTYSFIQTHTEYEKNKKLLEELIQEIDEKINSFIKTHQYHDVLGQFYIEFFILILLLTFSTAFSQNPFLQIEPQKKEIQQKEEPKTSENWLLKNIISYGRHPFLQRSFIFWLF